MSSSYHIRRDGNVGPDNYTLEQLVQMLASGSLLATDEATPAGQEQWQPLETAIAGAQSAAAAFPPPPPAPVATSGPARVSSGDWLMPSNIVRWVYRGCLMAVVVSTFLPWVSEYSVVVYYGITWWPGIIVFILGGAALGLTWLPNFRQWTFTGAGVCLLLIFLGILGAFLPPNPGGIPWRGFGIIIAIIVAIPRHDIRCLRIHPAPEEGPRLDQRLIFKLIDLRSRTTARCPGMP